MEKAEQISEQKIHKKLRMGLFVSLTAALLCIFLIFAVYQLGEIKSRSIQAEETADSLKNVYQTQGLLVLKNVSEQLLADSLVAQRFLDTANISDDQLNNRIV